MAFFDPPPPDRWPSGPEYSPWESWYSILPVAIDTRLVLAHTGNAAVVVTGLHVYDTGFLLHLGAITRRPMTRRRFQVMTDWAGEETVPDELLRFGVQFAGGGVATNLDTDRRTARPPAGPTLVSDGMSGGPSRIDEAFIVQPLPPAGPLRLVCQWPIFDIGETSAEIPGDRIRDAAGHVRRLWPPGDTEPRPADHGRP